MTTNRVTSLRELLQYRVDWANHSFSVLKSHCSHVCLTQFYQPFSEKMFNLITFCYLVNEEIYTLKTCSQQKLPLILHHKNVVFILKMHQMFSVHPEQEKFKKHKITGHFEFVFEEISASK